MYLPIDDPAMLCWMKTQVRVLEAWREELAMRIDVDLEAVRRVETHYQWLTDEIGRLDETGRRAA
ncbi:MAG: hypothetical protein AAGJ32_01670 [Pseudomonadota bacterium]